MHTQCCLIDWGEVDAGALTPLAERLLVLLAGLPDPAGRPALAMIMPVGFNLLDVVSPDHQHVPERDGLAHVEEAIAAGTVKVPGAPRLEVGQDGMAFRLLPVQVNLFSQVGRNPFNVNVFPE